MPLLTPEQIEERIALYERYAAALAKYATVERTVPVAFPRFIEFEWEYDAARTVGEAADAERRVLFVMERTWPALRAAVLKDAKKELDEAEAAVVAFERGDEVKVAR